MATTSFLNNFHQQVIKDNVNIGDDVTIIGKDEFKGLVGTVRSLKQTATLSGDKT